MEEKINKCILHEYNSVNLEGDIILPGAIKWDHEIPVTLGFGGKEIGVAKPVDQDNKEFLMSEIKLTDFDPKLASFLKSGLEGGKLKHSISFQGKLEGKEWKDVKITSASIVPNFKK